MVACLKRLIRRQFDVDGATSGEEALERLERFDPDVVISEGRMARMSGRELLRQVRERRPESLRMLMSGWVEPSEIAAVAPDRTANCHLAKPFAADDLLSTIRELLEERARPDASSGSAGNPAPGAAAPQPGGAVTACPAQEPSATSEDAASEDDRIGG